MSKKEKFSSGNQWFLRTGADAEFGPVEKQGLLLWAEQARILPGHEVSTDRKNWKPAISVDFLDMCWFIDEGDGDLKGPLNRKAARSLIKNGKLPEKSRIVSAVEASGGSEKGTGEEVKNPEKKQSETARKQSETAREQAETARKQAEAERQRSDSSGVSGELYQRLMSEKEAARLELVSVKKKLEHFQTDMRGRDNQIERLEFKLNEKSSALVNSERKIREAAQARESALRQSRDSERSFAQLLNDANKRDAEYKAKIDALKKNIALSPDQTDKFYSDQNAIYQLLKRELAEITKAMESERMYFDTLKTLEMERLSELEKRRRKLQNHIGDSPVEMTSRVLREQTDDPNAVRLRSEFDNLKIAYERATHRYQESERNLTHKLKVMKADYNKLMSQLLEKEREAESLQLTCDKLAVVERELSELRKSYEAERKQFVANNKALTARVVELEGGSCGTTPSEVQSSEAKNVKLASWMTFRK